MARLQSNSTRGATLILEALDSLPQDLDLSFNVSPETLINEDLRRVVEGIPLESVVPEVTQLG